MKAIQMFGAVLLLLVAISCQKESTLTTLTDDMISPKISVTNESEAKAPKVDICHYDDENDTWHVINVSANAMQAHLNHGDVLLVDADEDGWVEADNECVPGGDCNDADAAVNPGTTEVPYDGIDNDCDPSTPDDDLDGDGYPLATDCDDADAAVNPGSEEVCGDEIDNNCDGQVDEDCGPEITGCWADLWELYEPHLNSSSHYYNMINLGGGCYDPDILYRYAYFNVCEFGFDLVMFVYSANGTSFCQVGSYSGNNGPYAVITNITHEDAVVLADELEEIANYYSLVESTCVGEYEFNPPDCNNLSSTNAVTGQAGFGSPQAE